MILFGLAISCERESSRAVVPASQPAAASSLTAPAETRASDEETSENIAYRAAAHYRQGDLDGAIRVLEAGVKAMPFDAQLKFMLGNAYFRQKDWPAAIRFYQAAQRLRPYHPDTPLCLGHAYYMNGATQEAVRSWREAVQQAPRGELSRLALAVGLYRAGNLDEATGLMREMMSSDPDWKKRTSIDVRWPVEMRLELDRLALATTSPGPTSQASGPS